jgi:hypothetical protein
VAVEFVLAPLRHAVHVLPDVMRAVFRAADPDDPALFAPLESRLALLADDLEWWMRALATARTAGG